MKSCTNSMYLLPSATRSIILYKPYFYQELLLPYVSKLHKRANDFCHSLLHAILFRGIIIVYYEIYI